jgi:hypothetical protein
MSAILPLLIIGGTASLLPVWRSGAKVHLNFWQMLGNHTVWSDDVMYVPKELLTRGADEWPDELPDKYEEAVDEVCEIVCPSRVRTGM